MYSVDLNSDIGESFGRYTIGRDSDVLRYVTSANIACGYHAGDPVVMEQTVKMAIDCGVGIGAHPGYPDLMGFGRRSMKLSMEEVRSYMIYQIGALKAFVSAHGGRLQHVKPHGALYNDAAKNPELARAIARAIYDLDKDLILMGLAGSCMISEAEEIGLRVANEVFADRAYNPDGSLVSRAIEGSVIHDTEECVSRVKSMIIHNRVQAIDGSYINLRADSICVHGDSIQALDFVKALRKSIEAEGIELRPLDAK